MDGAYGRHAVEPDQSISTVRRSFVPYIHTYMATETLTGFRFTMKLNLVISDDDFVDDPDDEDTSTP
jgi:hypothetical protein